MLEKGGEQMEFNTLLMALRESRGLTMKSVAESVGVKPDTYRNYETGRFQPNFETLSKLADFYGVTTDYLLGRSEDAPDPLQQLPVTPQDRAILAAYIALSAKDRTQLVEIIGKIANGAELEAPSIKQTTYTSRVASRDGSPPRVEEITPEHLAAIENAPEADPDL